MVKDKRGIVKTLEAILAIVILLGAVLFFFRGDTIEEEYPSQVREAHNFIFQEISLNQTFRNCLTNNPTYSGVCSTGCRDDIQLFIDQTTPIGFSNACEICDKAITCTNLNLPADKSIFADSALIIEHPVSKVIRVYFYKRE